MRAFEAEGRYWGRRHGALFWTRRAACLALPVRRGQTIETQMGASTRRSLASPRAPLSSELHVSRSVDDSRSRERRGPRKKGISARRCCTRALHGAGQRAGFSGARLEARPAWAALWSIPGDRRVAWPRAKEERMLRAGAGRAGMEAVVVGEAADSKGPRAVLVGGVPDAWYGFRYQGEGRRVRYEIPRQRQMDGDGG